MMELVWGLLTTQDVTAVASLLDSLLMQSSVHDIVMWGSNDAGI